VSAEERTHAIVVEAPPSTAGWTRLLTLDAFRYQGSGWWLDRAMPRGAGAFLAFAFGAPIAIFLVGLGLADDRDAFVATHDVNGQLAFMALHILCLRVAGTLWVRGLGPALGGIGVGDADAAFVRRGLFGTWANVGALACCAYFVVRDTWLGWVPGANGLTAFDDPDQWDFGALGLRVHVLQTAQWHFEWLIFGYLMWIQVWTLGAITRAIRRTDFEPHLARMLVRDDYRGFFTLLGKSATVCLIFAVANLAFIYYTGELFPKHEEYVSTLGMFLEEMSDLLSVALLFVALLVGFVWHVRLLRRALTATVNRMFAAAGDAALEELAVPVELSGDPAADVRRLERRVEASSGLLRAIVFQREVDALGGRSVNLMLAKALVPLGTVAIRVYKMLRQV
jgi:hypothetical protein